MGKAVARSFQPVGADPSGNVGEGEDVHLVSSVDPLSSLVRFSLAPFRGDENQFMCEQIREVKNF